MKSAFTGEGEMAARVLELWRRGTEPYSIVVSLRVHPLFVRSVLKEYDELLSEWKKASVVEAPSGGPREVLRPRPTAERDERMT